MKLEKEKTLAWSVLLRRGLLLVLLVLAGVMVIHRDLEQENRPLPTPTPTVAPVRRDERSAREAAYDKDMEALKILLESDDTGVRDQASQRLARMVDEHQSELAIEEALVQAGFSSGFVIMQNGAVTVMVAASEMTEENSAMILALCTAHADVGAENVRIMSALP